MKSNHIRNRLADKGLNYACIARRHRTSAHYVSVVIQRWASKSDGVPRGLTRIILADISREIGEAVTPAISHLLN